MAKMIKKLAIKAWGETIFQVFADDIIINKISEIAGVVYVVRANMPYHYHVVYCDPRYDMQELRAEIEALGNLTPPNPESKTLEGNIILSPKTNSG